MKSNGAKNKKEKCTYARHNFMRAKTRSSPPLAAEFSDRASALASEGLGVSAGGSRVAVVTKQSSPRRLSRAASPAPPPLSSSQALILLASPRARRGVRVGSICLCDGRRCQTPRGLEGEERGLVLESGN